MLVIVVVGYFFKIIHTAIQRAINIVAVNEPDVVVVFRHVCIDAFPTSNAAHKETAIHLSGIIGVGFQLGGFACQATDIVGALYNSGVERFEDLVAQALAYQSAHIIAIVRVLIVTAGFFTGFYIPDIIRTSQFGVRTLAVSYETTHVGDTRHVSRVIAAVGLARRLPADTAHIFVTEDRDVVAAVADRDVVSLQIAGNAAHFVGL